MKKPAGPGEEPAGKTLFPCPREHKGITMDLAIFHQNINKIINIAA